MRKASRATQVNKLIQTRSFPIACGDAMAVGDAPEDALEEDGWGFILPWVRHQDGLCAARAWGTSMEPRIENGHWILFTLTPGGDPRERVVIMEDRGRPGIVGRTLKKLMATHTQLPDLTNLL